MKSHITKFQINFNASTSLQITLIIKINNGSKRNHHAAFLWYNYSFFFDYGSPLADVDTIKELPDILVLHMAFLSIEI